ncbi:MAG: cytidylate kinase-like family protein [Thermodesulfobacteriota bacterium]|nr:cytidylate kinase-like family protein [Thermodesulfobacteriota bacterium]
MAVITIDGEYGSKSREVGQIAAEQLGYEYVARDLVAQIADKLHISESEAELFSKTGGSNFLRHIDRYTCSIVKKVVDGDYGCLDDKKYFEVTKELVKNLYEDGNVVILGWGSQCILGEKPDTLHVRIKCNETVKKETVMAARGVSAEKAEKIIKKEESDAAAYIKHYFNQDINDARLYDLVIDTGATPVDKAATMIVNHLSGKAG